MIETALLLSRLLLAAVLAVAGLAKLADLAGSRRALAGFGVPQPLARPLALGLPLAELSVAALLLPASTARYGLLGALVLLAAFTAAIATAVARGRTPDCHCFGQLHSAPAGRRTLVRNGALAAVAALALAAGWANAGPSAVAWVTTVEGVVLAAAASAALAVAVAAGAAWAFLHLLRAQGRLLLRLDRLEESLAEAGIVLAEEDDRPVLGLALGGVAPAFTLRDTRGERVGLQDLLAAERPLLLVFTDPGCGPCRALMRKVSVWQRELAERLRVAVVSSGRLKEVRAAETEHGLERVLIDRELRVYQAYEGAGTPSAVLISPDGRIASPLAAGAGAIEELLERALAGEFDAGDHVEEGLSLGTPAPALSLPDLDGGSVELAELRGESTLLLFWNPGCGFCQAMRNELAALEGGSGTEGPRLVVVSSGGEKATRADAFRSRVLLDPEFAAGSAFGAGGTPMAVLLDGEGRVASPVVAGADAVLGLLRLRVEAAP